MFEVGKKYTSNWSNGLLYEVLYKSGDAAFVKNSNGNCTVLKDSQYNNYREYVPPKPLTFDDLKVGEKFKWVKTRHCGPGVICLKLEVVGGVDGPKIPFACCASQYGWTALEGNRIGTIWGQNNEEVERVS